VPEDLNPNREDHDRSWNVFGAVVDEYNRLGMSRSEKGSGKCLRGIYKIERKLERWILSIRVRMRVRQNYPTTRPSRSDRHLAAEEMPLC
jgi:hypothetical protein